MPLSFNEMTRPAQNGFAPYLASPPQSPPERSAGRLVSSSRDGGTDRLTSAKIAIVDDNLHSIRVVQKCLYDVGYRRFVTTTASAEAMSLITREHPDLLLLDIATPEINGLGILREVRAASATERLPVLVLTATDSANIKRRALDLGATDFLVKPVDPHGLIPRVRNVLLKKAYEDRLASERMRLEKEVRRRTADLAASRGEVVRCLARAAEYRDDKTGRHVERVGKYVGIIARERGFDEAKIELMEMAAQLHDLGKVAIPDAILRKPGKLDSDERALMQKHCAFAKRILEPISEDQSRRLLSLAHLGVDEQQIHKSPLLIMAARIAQTHHERWDGRGYPLGLAGEDIPIEGRMTAVADVYDALSSRRSYKTAYPREKCFAILQEGRGGHFDPDVLDAFFKQKKRIIDVQARYRNGATL